MSATGSETAGPNSANSANPDPELFYELVSKATTLIKQHIVKPDSLSTYIYYIARPQRLAFKNFDLKIHQGGSKEGGVLGVVRMHLRGFTVGVGDPDAVIEEGGNGREMIWEELERSQKWAHKIYSFKYGSGPQRKTYTYRKNYRGLGSLKSMDLRVGGVEDEEGELVAKWVSGSRWIMKPGNLFIKNIRHKGQYQGEPEEEEVKNWEVMVLLTVFGIIESQIRRK